MSFSFASPAGATVAAAIHRGATVCTATQRLSRAMHAAWIDRMRDEGREVWPTPDILPYHAWLRRLVQADATRRAGDPNAEPHPRILDEQQELLTWEDAASSTGVLDTALQPRPLAAAMMEAHDVALAWDIAEPRVDGASPGRDHGNDGPTGDAAAYHMTRAAVRERWRRLGAAPGGSLAWRAIEAIRMNPAIRPQELVLAGFDIDTDMAFRAMQHTLDAHDVRIRVYETEEQDARQHFLRYPSFEAELLAAAHWCRVLLEQGETDIGVVIPHLDHVRQTVDRVFADVLQPIASRRPEIPHRPAYELSLGCRTTEEPLITAALLLLACARRSLPLEHWTRVLHSPFTRGAEQWGLPRARVDLALRRVGMRHVDAADVRDAASHVAGAADDPLLARIMEQMEEKTPRTPSQWAEHFLARLEAFGWPGDRVLTSREYQARARFDELLAEFSALDAVCAPLDHADALGRFRHLASARVFQVQSTGAPVQILGVRETAALRFAHCRVLGMNDDIWPPQPRPAAFIPLPLQRRAGVPAASPERFLAQVRRQTGSLRGLAPVVLFSCSDAEGDRLLLPTPLLADLMVEDVPGETASIDATDTVSRIGGSARESLSQLSDQTAPVVAADEDIRGGTGVLTLQSACPFRAFAMHRLHAERPATVEHGVRSLDRGSLVHDAMEEIWSRLARVEGSGGMDPLSPITEEALRLLIESATGDVIARQRTLRGRRVAPHVLEAEYECLTMLLAEWFAVERQRTAFEVAAHEQRIECVLAGLHLFVRADRIDRLVDGGIALIDYKTGRKSVDDWLSERPSEPQLPLYVHALGGDVRAAGFAIVRRGECRLVGLRDDASGAAEFPSVSEYFGTRDPDIRSWEDLAQRWTAVLTRLATDFMQGDARVDPRDGADTCAYCELPSLCRVLDAEEGRAS